MSPIFVSAKSVFLAVRDFVLRRTNFLEVSFSILIVIAFFRANNVGESRILADRLRHGFYALSLEHPSAFIYYFIDYGAVAGMYLLENGVIIARSQGYYVLRGPKKCDKIWRKFCKKTPRDKNRKKQILGTFEEK